MSALNDFTALTSDIRSHQQQLTALYEKITRPDEKQMMGQLIDEIENARLQAEEIVPKTPRQIEDSARQTATQAKTHLAQLRQRKKQMQTETEKNASKVGGAAPEIPALERETRVDPKLGPTLRQELLERFSQPTDAPLRPDAIKEAWEDWQ